MKNKTPRVDREAGPVRRGTIYCSPWCGGDCLHSAYLKSISDAAKLCAVLDRTTLKGWVPHVWENLGWHHAAISACGRIKVHPFNDGSAACTAFLGSADSLGGTWSAQGKTPAASVRAVIDEAKRALAGHGALLVGLGAEKPRIGRPQLVLVA